MKKITKDYEVYSFNELNSEAKDKVKNWLLDDDVRNDIFMSVNWNFLNIEFPRSDLKNSI